MTIDGAEIPHAEFLEQHVLEQQVFGPFLHPVGEGAGRLAGDFLNKLRGLPADGGIGGVGLERVEIAGDGSDILVDGPLVVVEHDDEFPGRFRDVVESLQCRPAGERGISGHGDDVVVATGQVPCGGHAEGG